MADNTTHDYASLSGQIVVGIDGTEQSFAALRWALRQAELTGQTVNAVYGWSYSWDMGDEPQTEQQEQRLRVHAANQLREWVNAALDDFDIADEQIKLTSFKSSGSSALLDVGRDAQQIVVGRRTMNGFMRFIRGSLSTSLAEESPVPVTVIRTNSDEDLTVQDEIANALTPDDRTYHYETPTSPIPRTSRPIVVGVDGSEFSKNALVFAATLASIHGAPLHVMYCWQYKDLGKIPGYDTTVAPMNVAQEFASNKVRTLVDSTTLPADVHVEIDTFHIAAGRGLVSASRYARHIVVGSRGLTGLDAHFLGSVSKQVLNSAECNVTIVH